MTDKTIVKPEYLESSIGAVLKYSFDTYEELEEFFLKLLASFKKTNVKTKVIGKSILIFKNAQ
jgi:hypothetical protein